MESQDQILVRAAGPAEPHALEPSASADPRRAHAPRASSLQRRFWNWIRSGGSLWLPLLVCAAGSVLSVLAGSAIVSYETRQLKTTLANTAASTARAIESRFAREVSDLQELGRVWSEFGTADKREWQAEAEQLMQRSKAILAVEWDPKVTALVHETVEGLEVLEALGGDPSFHVARTEAMNADTETFLGPYPLPGRQVYELFLPVLKDKEVKQIAAVLDPAILIEAVPLAEGHVLSVAVGDHVLYQRGELGERSEQMTMEASIDLGRGENWRLTVQPDPNLQSLGSRLPRWIVLAGLVISVLLAGMVRLGQLTWSGSRQLLESNAGLNGRLREVELDRERTLSVIAALQEEKQGLKQENRRLRDEAQARGEEVVHQDSVVAELEAFTYSVSHDLRSPLGAILNYAAAMSEDCGDKIGEDGREYLARIAGSARSAVSMMDGLLVFSRVGRHELRRAKVDVREIVREVYDELARAMDGRAPELSMGELPGVEADPTLLRVLVTNLLSNAFKFTRQTEGPKLEVGGYVQGAETVYYFEDNGIGFDMHDAGRLFGVFERLHGSTQYEGHGVGLAVVERIARRHGGTVRAEAVLGKGATFFVSFPQRRPAA
jgi:signal transduction histidine kinase